MSGNLDEFESMKQHRRELRDNIIESYKDYHIDTIFYFDYKFRETVRKNYKLYNSIRKNIHDVLLDEIGEGSQEKLIIKRQFTVRDDNIYKCYTTKEVSFRELLENNFLNKLVSQYDISLNLKNYLFLIFGVVGSNIEKVERYEGEEEKKTFLMKAEEVPEDYRVGSSTNVDYFDYHIGYRLRKDHEGPPVYYTRGLKEKVKDMHNIDSLSSPAENEICTSEPNIKMEEIKILMAHRKKLIELVTKSYEDVSEDERILMYLKQISE